ncbi:MAG TPA: purine-nucleoside phosphorylase [Chitinophagaceae bacterium]|nr:purine-nucleoside phosphorylase [Chitinophagaceae bacterium]
MFASEMYADQLREAAAWLLRQNMKPDVGVVLGTGLNLLLEHTRIIKQCAFTDIPHFPSTTVEKHEGRLVYGTIGNKKVLIMQGRVHYYEDYTMQQVVFPVRVMKLAGIKWLFLTNACGAIDLNIQTGTLALVKDHINLQSSNPLKGKNMDELGIRFPDMNHAYSPQLNQLLRQKADELGITLSQGVYAAVDGPNLETPAEYRYLKIIGANLVGMSTVPEVIAAKHMGLPCAAVSVVTDQCDPDNLKDVTIDEILAAAAKGDQLLAPLLRSAIEAL